LKIRPLTYTQIQLLKQKEDELELEEVKKTAFGNSSSSTVETPLSFEKKEKRRIASVDTICRRLNEYINPTYKNT
jgi:hypothetical protein